MEQEKRQQKVAIEQEAERVRRAQAVEAEQQRKDVLMRKIGPKLVEFIKVRSFIHAIKELILGWRTCKWDEVMFTFFYLNVVSEDGFRHNPLIDV